MLCHVMKQLDEQFCQVQAEGTVPSVLMAANSPPVSLAPPVTLRARRYARAAICADTCLSRRQGHGCQGRGPADLLSVLGVGAAVDRLPRPDVDEGIPAGWLKVKDQSWNWRDARRFDRRWPPRTRRTTLDSSA